MHEQISHASWIQPTLNSPACCHASELSSDCTCQHRHTQRETVPAVKCWCWVERLGQGHRGKEWKSKGFNLDPNQVHSPLVIECLNNKKLIFPSGKLCSCRLAMVFLAHWKRMFCQGASLTPLVLHEAGKESSPQPLSGLLTLCVLVLNCFYTSCHSYHQEAASFFSVPF